MSEHVMTDAAAEIIGHLAVEFAGRIPLQRVEATVGIAETHLRGQVPAGALPEMLHRLAAYRLSQQVDACR